MELDYNKIIHNYIIRVVIFSAFLYRNKVRDAEVYKKSVSNYIFSKTKLLIDMEVDDIDINENRLNIINDILYGKKYSIYVRIKIKTPLKSVSLNIDINDDKTYEKYLYS